MSLKRTAHPVAFGTGLVTLDVLLANGHPAVSAGGTCGNVLTILSWFGWDARPVARLNGDAAGQAVREDLRRFGVHLEFAEQTPTAATPVIIERLRSGNDGVGIHRFSLTCPTCKSWLPRHQPVPVRAIREILDHSVSPQVFFFDRLSRGALLLAERTVQEGGLVWFEPSKVDDEAMFAEALTLAHVLKYSKERLPALAQRTMGRRNSCPLLEIETAGADGLRYRGHSLQGPNRWRELRAIPALDVVDTAGAGDWFSATLLNQIATSGVNGLEQLLQNDEPALTKAICNAQAASAVSCAFAGARGAMYTLSRSKFFQRVEDRLGARRRKPDPQPAWPSYDVTGALCKVCGSALDAWALHQ